MMMLSLKNVLNKALGCCYTSTILTNKSYRKYADGTAVLWGHTGSKSHAMTSSSGSGFYTTGEISLPDGLFKSIDCAICQRCGGNTVNYLISTSISAITTSLLTYFIFCTVQATASVDVAYLVIGKWK